MKKHSDILRSIAAKLDDDFDGQCYAAAKELWHTVEDLMKHRIACIIDDRRNLMELLKAAEQDAHEARSTQATAHKFPRTGMT